MNIRFPFSVEVSVRGYEMDPFGHVNNAVYLQWLEHARWELSRQAGFAMDLGDMVPVVRHYDLHYLAETRLGDRLRVSLWPRRAGQTSFVLGAAIRILEEGTPEGKGASRAGAVAFRANLTLVCVNRPARQKVPVPDVWRPLFPASDPGDALPPGV